MKISNAFMAKKISIVVTGFWLMLAIGCKTFAPLPYPDALSLPGTFGGSTDSASFADLPWRQFYTDEHLQKLIDTTLKNNPDLQIALQNIEIAAAIYQQTGGPLLPTVSGVSSVTVESFGRNTLEGKRGRGSGLNTSYFLGLQSAWEIDIWKRLRNTRKAAYLRLLASQNGVQMVRTTLVAEVARRYYDLVALNMNLTIIRRNIGLQESAVEIMAVQKEAGRATELAVQQFRAQVLNTKELEVASLRQITNLENQINLLARRTPQAIARIDSLPNVGDVSVIKTGVPSALLQRRPDLRQAELEIQASEADIAVARAAFFPRLNIIPFVGLNPANLTNLVTPGAVAAGVAGSLTAPLFNRRIIEGAYNRVTAQTEQAYYNYQNVVATSFYEVMNSLNDLVKMKEQFQLKQQEAATLRHAVEISRDLYLAGYATYLEVILAQRNVVEVELESVTRKNSIFQAYINLYRALGGGWK